MGGSKQLMHRIRSLLAALAALAITAGLVAAHAMPAASNGGLDTARQASGKQVPLGVDASAPHDNTTKVDQDTAGAPPAGTHGADVSAAAKAPTPAGDWANHGAYVSSIAKGWGQTTSAAHKNAHPTSDPTNHLPTAAATGLSHRP
jgi:hypothetical protein